MMDDDGYVDYQLEYGHLKEKFDKLQKKYNQSERERKEWEETFIEFDTVTHGWGTDDGDVVQTARNLIAGYEKAFELQKEVDCQLICFWCQQPRTSSNWPNEVTEATNDKGWHHMVLEYTGQWTRMPCQAYAIRAAWESKP